MAHNMLLQYTTEDKNPYCLYMTMKEPAESTHFRDIFGYERSYNKLKRKTSLNQKVSKNLISHNKLRCLT